MKRRDFLTRGLPALAGPLLLPRAGFAQARYPERPVRLIVPFPPGGAYDTIGRPWADRMKSTLGTVVIENLGGGGGSVGAAQATRQRPDGYTLLLGGATTHITEGLLKTRPMYDPLKDLVPVSGIAVTAFAITVHPSVPAKDLKQLIALARANPDALPWGSAGHGSLNHLTGELFKLQSGIPGITHVPYKGAGPAIVDLIGGQIPMIVPAMTNHVLALHRSGRARVVAVTHGTRLAAAPEIPTAAEQGFPKLISPNFIGIYAPAGTPTSITEQISAANIKLLAEPSYRELLVSGTFEIEPPMGPDAYKRYVEDEMRRWEPIVKALGIKIDF